MDLELRLLEGSNQSITFSVDKTINRGDKYMLVLTPGRHPKTEYNNTIIEVLDIIEISEDTTPYPFEAYNCLEHYEEITGEKLVPFVIATKQYLGSDDCIMYLPIQVFSACTLRVY